MAGPKRLILFVEGEGDALALPVLVKKLLTDMQAWEHVFLDPSPFQVGNVAEITREEGRRWIRYLQDAQRRPNLGGVLLLQDGDLARIRGETFCSRIFGARLAEWARNAGGGSIFSVATVFACQEYESWLIACAEELAGQPLPDGRSGIYEGTTAPAGDLEVSPRDAKGWLNQCIEAGYKPTRDQAPFTQLMIDHLGALRSRELRSFRRRETALLQLVQAIRAGDHILTPVASPPTKE